jgi:hypothetical protein
MTEMTQLDPYQSDPDRWGTSLAQVAEIMRPVLDASGAESIVEVGAFAGDLTRVLVQWATGAGATVGAVDPSPQPGLVKLAEEHPEVALIRETSLEALPHIDLPDAFVIDGDHNYWTVSEELRLIAERAGDELPLLLFHDVCWPHARRDDYFAADLIPEDYRQPVADGDGGIFPGEPGLRRNGGLPYPRSAVSEGGPRNGVLTAIEDFVDAREDLRLVVVPAFFGFGVVWRLDAPYADDLARILDPYDRHPVLERLEANRVHHLALGQTRAAEIWKHQERQARQEAVLRRLLESSAFSIAERLSRLRERVGVGSEYPVVSKEDVRRALEE